MFFISGVWDERLKRSLRNGGGKMIERETWWEKYVIRDKVLFDPSEWWALERSMRDDGKGDGFTGNVKVFKTKELRDKFVEENGFESKGEE